MEPGTRAMQAVQQQRYIAIFHSSWAVHAGVGQRAVDVK